jgi:hypothetical protein
MPAPTTLVLAQILTSTLSTDSSVAELLRRQANFLEDHTLSADLKERGAVLFHHALFTETPDAIRAGGKLVDVLRRTIIAVGDLYLRADSTALSEVAHEVRGAERDTHMPGPMLKESQPSASKTLPAAHKHTLEKDEDNPEAPDLTKRHSKPDKGTAVHSTRQDTTMRAKRTSYGASAVNRRKMGPTSIKPNFRKPLFSPTKTTAQDTQYKRPEIEALGPKKYRTPLSIPSVSNSPLPPTTSTPPSTSPPSTLTTQQKSLIVVLNIPNLRDVVNALHEKEKEQDVGVGKKRKRGKGKWTKNTKLSREFLGVSDDE